MFPCGSMAVVSNFKFYDERDTELSGRFSKGSPARRESVLRAYGDPKGNALANVFGVPDHERLPAPVRRGGEPAYPSKKTVAEVAGRKEGQASAQVRSSRQASVNSVAALGSLLRDARKAAGFNQQQLADLAGVGRRFVSELEAGKPTLEIERVFACCHALGIDISATRRV